MPAVVIGELLAGFEVGARRERNRMELDLVCESVRVEVAPMTWATAERYAAIHKYRRAEGSPIPTNDLWIAAAAMERGPWSSRSTSSFDSCPRSSP